MRKKINGALYDTATASLIAETESMTALSGKVSTRLFKCHSGQWFQSISPVERNGYQAMSNWISANIARRWLENHSYHFQLREYFGYFDNRVKSERKVLVWYRGSNSQPFRGIFFQPFSGGSTRQSSNSFNLIPLTLQRHFAFFT